MMIGGSIIINTFGAAACIGAIYGSIFNSSAADTCGNKRSFEHYSASFVGVNYDDNRQDLSLDIKQQNACSSYFNGYVYLDSGSPDSVDQDDNSESQDESGNESDDDENNESSEDESGSGEYEDSSHDESGTDGDDSNGSDGDSNNEAPEGLENDASDLEPTEDEHNDETSENNNVDSDSRNSGSVSDNSASSDSGENASSGSTHTRTEVIHTVSSGESVESSEPVEYEQGVIDLLSIISGCLIFLVLVVLLKYIYKFFRIFF